MFPSVESVQFLKGPCVWEIWRYTARSLKPVKRLDNYSDLALATGDVHKLIHAAEPNTIQKYLDKLKDTKLNFAKLNKFRSLVGNCKIEYR